MTIKSKTSEIYLVFLWNFGAIFSGGTQILVQRLSDEAQRLGLKVFLGQEVCAVEESGEKCLVHCQKGGRFQAKCVVLTVSLGAAEISGTSIFDWQAVWIILEVARSLAVTSWLAALAWKATSAAWNVNLGKWPKKHEYWVRGSSVD